MVDTSVLVAGIAGFRDQPLSGENPSAVLMREWIEEESFVWVISDEILDEYKEVLGRCRVHCETIGRVVNLLREEAEIVVVGATSDVSPDPKDNPFCACAEEAKADFIVTLNPRDFPQERLTAKVLAPSALIRAR